MDWNKTSVCIPAVDSSGVSSVVLGAWFDPMGNRHVDSFVMAIDDNSIIWGVSKGLSTNDYVEFSEQYQIAEWANINTP